jgi:hypothetical protein
MRSLWERLFDTVTVLATPLLAAVTKKAKPKHAAARPTRRRVPAAKRPARPSAVKRGGRPAATKKAARPSAAPKGARPKKMAGRAGARAGGRAATSTAPAKAPAAAPAPPGPPPPKPVPPTGRAILLAPENGKFADNLHPKFRWLSVGGATRYEVAWSDRADLSDSHTIVSIATEAAVPDEEPLEVGTTYYWRVRGGNESGWGPWSPASSFQALEEPPTA